ncbi:carboxypeptidase-like regulatory domain-containing protein [Pseudomonas sp. PDM27]|uniref:carboxypeptidase-like regulatory domain-containing protein n=1 Tax=Pseudomonas sp. PDM27 TaxID=2854769 RepID=UPI001C46D139|nr:carboxypeptidase-like regulatory domain-containing protein [Pseudomonas sp. PDM27]MBV7568601.1 hypothetical protein [Pseudomonas sp. PDM27]
MTAKPPNTSTLTSDTQNETTDTVTFDSIKDSKGNLVPKNGVTYDSMLVFEGKTGAGRMLTIRDRLTPIGEVKTLSSGIWNKQLDFSNLEFKRFNLNAIQQDPPQNTSNSYVFIWATEKPIIKVVTGEHGPIDDDDTYTGTSPLEFTGNAPPGMEVEAFNDGTTTDKKVEVNPDGLFKLTLDGLTAGTYKITIKAANGKESDVFTFHVASDIELILDRVYDSRGKIITERDTTYSKWVRAEGFAWIGKQVQLLDFDDPVDGAIGTAEEPDGHWKIEFELSPPKSYSLTAMALYGEGETSKFPYLFDAAVDVKLSLDHVFDSKGEVLEGRTTYDKKVKICGYVRPGKRVQLHTRGDSIGPATPSDAVTGYWEIELDVAPPEEHELTVKGLYDDEEFSAPPRTFFVREDVALSLDHVLQFEGGPPVDEGDTTNKTSLFITGHARPGESIQLFNGRDPIEGAIATADPESGVWKYTLDVQAGFYSLTAQANYGDNETTHPPRTFNVVLDLELSLDDVLESEDGPPVDEGETTAKKLLFIFGHALPGESIQLLNHGKPIEGAIATADPESGIWKYPLDVEDGFYSLTAQANYGDNETTHPPRTFTVVSIIKPHNTRAFDLDGLIEDFGTTLYNYVIVRGVAAPLATIKLKINGVTDPKPEPTDDTGKWARLVQNLNYGTKYEFIAEADYGDNDESNPWTISVAAALRPSISAIKGALGPIDPDATTIERAVTVEGRAHKDQKVEIWDGTNRLTEALVGPDDTFSKDLNGLTAKTYDLKIKPLYGTGVPDSDTQSFTVINWPDSVTTFNDDTLGKWQKGIAFTQSVVTQGVLRNVTTSATGHAGPVLSQAFVFDANEQYSFTFRVRNISGQPTNLTPKFSVTIGAEELIPVFNVPRDGQWHLLSARISVPRTNNYTLYIKSNEDRGGGTGPDGGNDYELDDIIVRQIRPEWSDSITDFNDGSSGSWSRGPAALGGEITNGVFHHQTVNATGNAGVVFSNFFRFEKDRTYSFSYRLRNFSADETNKPPRLSVSRGGATILPEYSIPRDGEWHPMQGEFSVPATGDRYQIDINSHEDRGGGSGSNGGNDYEIDDIVILLLR